MTATTCLTAETTVELAPPPEPVELRARMRRLAEDAPARAQAAIAAGEWIAAPLWDVWGEALERAGMDQGRLAAVAHGQERELWLWVMGERTWAHCAAGLAGRVLRRLPPP
jgi:hypothetical protein